MSQNAVLDEIIPAGKPWSGIVEQGHYLSIVDLEGQQGVDFLCYNADNPEERYHAPNTLKAIETLKLTAGHTLYSDIARPLFTITHDSCNGHDTIAGCCSAPRGASNPGDYVSLQAQMKVLAVISNCPQLNNPCNSGKPTDIRVIVSQSPWNP
jgi:uncharacterized protein YcgI (DUF1989 family)